MVSADARLPLKRFFEPSFPRLVVLSFQELPASIEIENAGIHRTKALKLLKKYEKIFVFVTHDPRIALLSDFRIIMSNGAMQKMITTNAEEKMAALGLKKIDDVMLEFRTRIRAGEEITDAVFSEQIKDLATSYQIYLKRKKTNTENCFFKRSGKNTTQNSC